MNVLKTVSILSLINHMVKDSDRARLYAVKPAISNISVMFSVIVYLTLVISYTVIISCSLLSFQSKELICCQKIERASRPVCFLGLKIAYSISSTFPLSR